MDLIVNSSRFISYYHVNLSCLCKSFLDYSQYCFIAFDIAFNKPAVASSAHINEWNYYGPQYVNNGKADCEHISGPIAHTKNEANPWFKVDLRGTFNIETVAVLPRASKFIRSFKTMCLL